MRKIIFIGRWLCSKEIAGIHRYALEVLKELDEVIPYDEVELIIPAGEPENYNFKHIKVIPLGLKLGFLGRFGDRLEGYLYKNLFARSYIKKIDAISVDLLLQFPRFPCELIAIYDCRPCRFPESYSFSKKQQKRREIILCHQSKSIKNCSAIITDSQTISSEIAGFYRYSEKPIHVIYCAWQHFNEVAEDLTILDRLDLRDNGYYFSMGTRLPHKNIKWVSYAAKKHPEYKFVISGSLLTDSADAFEGERLPNMVFAGRLSDSEVKALMKHCKAFIQPSLYEGFGMPPLEAMSTGADCIVSDIPVFREIYGNSVWYIDPTDYENIDLDKVMSKPKESNAVILNKFSWEKSAQELWAVLKALATEQKC